MVNVIEHLKKLQKKLCKSGTHYAYYRDIKNKTYHLIAKGNSWKEVEIMVKDKLGKFKNMPTYIISVTVGVNLKRIDIEPKDLKLVGGPLLVSVQSKKVVNATKIRKHAYDGREQNIWYTKKELSKRKFSFSDLRKIVKGVNEKKVNLHLFAKPTITDILALGSD
jgi:hypothetical protein